MKERSLNQAWSADTIGKLVLNESMDNQWVNAPDTNGLTPLMYAVSRPDTETLDKILQTVQGIDWFAQDTSLCNVFFQAVKYGKPDHLARLLEHCQLTEEQMLSMRLNGQTLLMAAVFMMVDDLRRTDQVWLSQEGKEGQARERAVFDIVLGDSRSGINAMDNYVSPPELTEPYRNTALIIAAQTANLYAVKALIEKGADLNYQNERGETAMIAAAIKGAENPCVQTECALVQSALFEANADREMFDKQGNRAIDYLPAPFDLDRF